MPDDLELLATIHIYRHRRTSEYDLGVSLASGERTAIGFRSIEVALDVAKDLVRDELSQRPTLEKLEAVKMP